MTTNTKPTNGDGLDTPHGQPAKSIPKITCVSGAICRCIKRASRGFTIDRGIDPDAIALLILAAILLMQGVLQWIH